MVIPSPSSSSSSILCSLGTVAFIVFLSSLLLFVSGDCDPNDKQILLQIQESLGNPQKLVDAWQLDTGCCNGWGVECDSNGRVTYVYASFSDQPFQIPSSIGDLEYLEYFTFADLPNLTGTIPGTITQLKYLQRIAVTNTQLSGLVPDFLGQIPSLQSIELGSNNLSGPIPHSLGQLQYLSNLDLHGNNLVGLIPDMFRCLNRSFNMQNPLTIVLSNNNLSGEIPRSMGEIRIQWIDLSGNQLTGDASFLFGQDKASLWYISLARNRFSFDFSNISIAASIMEDMDLRQNNISGRIPASLGDASWDEFNVSYNQLCGPIPQSLNSQLSDPTMFFHNKCLCGFPLSPCQ